jgi:hypothetical protein
MFAESTLRLRSRAFFSSDGLFRGDSQGIVKKVFDNE